MTAMGVATMGGDGKGDGVQFLSPRVFQQRLKARGVAVHLETVRRWCRAQRLDVRKIGAAWRIRESEVERVIEAGLIED
jgi:excisionase family DNA binding protein